MAFFRGNANQEMSERQIQINKFNSARSNLLLVIAFSLVNIILLLCGSGTYFIFSASIPYYTVFFGMMFCGKLPASNYEGLPEFPFLDNSFLVIMSIIAFITLALYLVAFIFSKKNKGGWLIFALVLFAVDTVIMFLFSGISIDSILDILFHIWILYYLITGVSACKKLKILPEEEAFYEDVLIEEETLAPVGDTEAEHTNEE